MTCNTINVPSPIIDAREKSSITNLSKRYEKLNNRNALSKAGKKLSKIIPDKLKQIGESAKKTVSEKELYAECMNVVSQGFGVLEEQAARLSISESTILKKVNKISDDYNLTSIEELCCVRSYELSTLVNKYKPQDIGLALIEGGTTGALGLAGLAFNLVLSTFLYYRAVQSVAMFYGYDAKNNAEELIIASQVFTNALSPSSSGIDEATSIVGKIMAMTEVTATRQLCKKSWEEMANHGGLPLLFCQIRALANKSAQKALEKAGQKGLEKSLFKNVFEQIGKSTTKKAIGKSVPIAGGVLGALFDTAQMNTVINPRNRHKKTNKIKISKNRLISNKDNACRQAVCRAICSKYGFLLACLPCMCQP
jgi:hypothetical protein